MGSLKGRNFTLHLTVVGLKKKPQRRKVTWRVSDTSRASTFLALAEMVSTKVSLPDDHPCWPGTWYGVKRSTSAPWHSYLCPTAFLAV